MKLFFLWFCRTYSIALDKLFDKLWRTPLAYSVFRPYIKINNRWSASGRKPPRIAVNKAGATEIFGKNGITNRKLSKAKPR